MIMMIKTVILVVIIILMIIMMIIVMTLDDILRMAERKTLFVQLAGTAFAFVVTIIAIIIIILVTQQIPTRCIPTRWE